MRNKQRKIKQRHMWFSIWLNEGPAKQLPPEPPVAHSQR